MPKYKLNKIITSKNCPICTNHYTIDNFWKSSKGYYSPYCKSCSIIKNKEWRHNNKQYCTKVRQRSK